MVYYELHLGLLFLLGRTRLLLLPVRRNRLVDIGEYHVHVVRALVGIVARERILYDQIPDMKPVPEKLGYGYVQGKRPYRQRRGGAEAIRIREPHSTDAHSARPRVYAETLYRKSGAGELGHQAAGNACGHRTDPQRQCDDKQQGQRQQTDNAPQQALEYPTKTTAFLLFAHRHSFQDFVSVNDTTFQPIMKRFWNTTLHVVLVMVFAQKDMDASKDSYALRW